MQKVVLTLDCPADLQEQIINHAIRLVRSHSKRGCMSINETDYAVDSVSSSDGVLVVHAEAGYGKMNQAITDTLNLTATA